MDNLQIWNSFADIDPQFTKQITGKDYTGTSPNPQYVIRCLTELFGPVGQGFGWRILEDGFQQLGDTHLHWCRIEFWHTSRDNTFEAYGQTKAAYVTSTGRHRVDEDAPKKSLTDAITKAASQIGIAANIFLGRWDDSRYVAQVNDEYRSKEQADAPPAPADPPFDPVACDERLRAGMAKLTHKDEATEWWRRETPALLALKEADLARYDKLRADLAAKKLPEKASAPSTDMIPGAFQEA